ncbi:hypothetical protein [Caldimonas brevitalea]|uniref:Uncharacterized protein n=1 Tax=Caldimonas brevitalea TaxID=413882 RepID=A0A0G3BLF7_9BURK|nr:hypothetical protein [Caldimonas brevitalea]AKJ28793.1 hypothetical protein AAW51_2102 [Caldimonas brevitalea]
MSKVEQAKAAQNYRAKPEHPSCSTCQHFSMETVEKTYQAASRLYTWTEEKNLRCTLGGFKVLKKGVCDKFALRQGDQK